MTAPRTLTCSACRFAATYQAAALRDHGDIAWCVGAAHALAAMHENDTQFPFSLCHEHAEKVRSSMEDALDARRKAIAQESSLCTPINSRP